MRQTVEVDNAIRIPTSLDESFFKYWLKFLTPFHHLTPRAMDVAAAFLKHRYDLSKVILDANILESTVMGEDVKKKIMEELGITPAHFLVIMGKLKKSKFIQDNKINPRYIPRVTEENANGSFNLVLLFTFNNHGVQ